MQAGYSGEQKVDKYLEQLELPQTSIVLTDIHLALSPGHTFQIDTLVLTEQAIIILEIKNITGELYFETDPYQLRRRKSSGEETIMDCPLTQLEVTQENLKVWLAKRGFHIEVSSQIILANKNGGVKTAPPNSPIIYLKRLSIFLRENERKPSIFSANQLKNISYVIMQQRLEYNPYPLCTYYQLDPKLLTTGQLCSKCNATMIYQNHKSRYCKWCKEKEPNNYGQSIQDWLMLINTTISNRECRYFLQINDRREAHYALRSLNLIKEGKSVATRYSWPNGIPFR
ncbi:nuclease-related domain-containing protein [Sporosarcina sp. Marseille-Q4063]|uniref:nuclease-related domain-containing protein n=1 Tax=Sporosarcina sp. Marseille-Q4063 TaxID=2810514 RepID=UPI0020161B14|nr:nuclease-related domain-containing protein [Sporosarcina sp. Marseille-Q4063]